eukprot:CAMPEP_0197425998 /NCGR_PEP_ID=MMETSP1170-20131217/33354_1 /TAXON_ID=54406 /ORGANISM="Sarcinochrysis sp, Strain CCMP770" /LENGTH=97 /DNA_ID=CAMNT_0042953605 /DNA_START=9 /DNA_END=303 /DNA_ORIENTATION=-
MSKKWLVFVAAALSVASAFVVPSTARGLTPTRSESPTSLVVAFAGEKKSDIDYVAIAGMFVNPLNPYSWFVYMFLGLYVYGTLILLDDRRREPGATG